jgi:hypothetical protein
MNGLHPEKTTTILPDRSNFFFQRQRPMKAPSMRWFGTAGFLVLASLLQGAARAETIGHAFDVQVSVVNGKLTTNNQLYLQLFDEWLATDNPGFAGALPQGRQYDFMVADKLWYHSGVQGAPVSTAMGSPFLLLGADPNLVTVSQTTGPQAGLTLASNLSGSLHAHVNFELFPQSGTPAPAGVYGLVLRLTSPSYESSDPFVIALANNPDFALSLEGVQYGGAAIRDAALVAVPEPGAGTLAVLGTALAAVGCGLRRLKAGRRSCKRVAGSA